MYYLAIVDKLFYISFILCTITFIDWSKLYPTQRVAEDVMFLTRQSVSPSVLFFLSVQLLWNRWTEFCETL